MPSRESKLLFSIGDKAFKQDVMKQSRYKESLLVNFSWSRTVNSNAVMRMGLCMTTDQHISPNFKSQAENLAPHMYLATHTGLRNQMKVDSPNYKTLSMSFRHKLLQRKLVYHSNYLWSKMMASISPILFIVCVTQDKIF